MFQLTLTTRACHLRFQSLAHPVEQLCVLFGSPLLFARGFRIAPLSAQAIFLVL